MRLFRYILSFSAILLACAGLKGQTAEQELMRYAGNIHQFNQIFPQEKIWLQFDNTSYYTGETIWFKAFVVEASTLHRAPSKVLYVELLSPTGVVLKQQKLKVVAGQADGSFTLLDGATQYTRDLRGVLAYPSGFYEVRAYTTNMLNFKEEALFSRVLPVFEKPSKEGDFYGEAPRIEKHYNKDADIEQFRPKGKKDRSALNIDFYPEGGNLVNGLESRVAFKLTGENGLGIDADCLLDDSIQLETVHDGMGCFTYTPGTSRDRLRVTYDGREYTFRTPDAAEKGFVIRADKSAGHIDVSVSSHGLDRRDTLGMSLTCRGELFGFKSFTLDDGSAHVRISTDFVPEGVCQLTLFDSFGTIYARRCIYNRRNDRTPEISYMSESSDARPFAPVHMEFKLTDRNGRGMRDRFCLSVRDSRCPGTAVSDDIRTSLLLSSDIRGCIYKPEYYFESDDAEHNKALDLLMMVQGWERYDWETMSGLKPYREVHRIEDSISVNGWVESPGARKPMDSIAVTAAIMTPDTSLVEQFRYVTGKDGYFGFNLSDFQDYARMTISAWPRHKRLIGTSARIRFERSMRPEVRAYTTIETLLADASGNITTRNKKDGTLPDNEDNLPKVVDINDGFLLPDVDIKDKRLYVDYFTFKSFNVSQDTEMELDLGEYSTDVSGYLIDKGYAVEYDDSGNIAGINGHRPFFYVHEKEKVVVTGLFESPGMIDTKDVISIMVFDDVMYETDAMKLTPLLQEYRRRHLDYDTPETLLEKEHRRVLLVDIFLKDEYHRATRKELKNINSRVTNILGFSQAYEFYSPQYPDGPVFGDVDYRRTIYWNPNVITDREGKASVDFYNNSYSTSFRVSGAGITASGVPYLLDSTF